MNNLTDKDFSLMESRIEYYWMECNVLGISIPEGNDGSELQKQILQNQKIVQKIQRAKQDIVKEMQNAHLDEIDIVISQGILKILNNITDDEK